MSAHIKDKTLVVTGATGHVGWGIARAAVDAGANVVLPVRDPDAARRLVDEFGEAHAAAVVVDYSSESSVLNVRSEAERRFGGIDHVFAPLGAWWQKGASLAQPPSELHDLLLAYVEAPWLLARTLTPALRARRGTFTFITGAAGEARNIPGAGLLVVAVKGQLALSQVLRSEAVNEPYRMNEIRIYTRIERTPRSGVVPSRVAGAAFLDVLEAPPSGALFRYDGRQLTRVDEST